MKINRDNYEAYLLDRLEGRLSAGEQQQLRDFLALNPDCDGGLEEEDLWFLSPEVLHFPEKEALRKEIPEAGQPHTGFHFDLFSIARLEGDLSGSQVRAHEKMMENHPHFLRDWEEWQLARLPKGSLVYPWKAQLKKPDRRSQRISWITLLSAAAVVTLVLLLTLRSGPSVQFSEDFHISVPGIEQQHLVSPTVPDPLQLSRQAEVPAPLSGQGPESAVPVKVLQKETRLYPFQPGEEAQTARLQGMAGTEWDESRLKTSVEVERDLTELSLSRQLARISPSAPVPEGSLDRIRPLHLSPSPVHHKSVAITSLKDLNLQEVVEKYAEENDLSLWTIASAGIRGINRIAGSDLELYAARDDEGDISGFQFKSKRLNISTPLQKPE